MKTTQDFFNMTNTDLPNASNSLLSTLQNGYISLIDQHSLIRANGEDSATFLHNQLSNDVEHLTEGQAKYAAYCTPKGRMLASLYYWKDAHGIVMQCSATLQPAFQKRLQMFVMRAKAKLEDVTQEFTLIGVGGAKAQLFLENHFTKLPKEINDKLDSEAGSLIRVHDAFGHARYLWIIRHALFANVWRAHSTEMTLVDASVWRLADIHAGIPQVIEKTKEQFVPQMINFELIGGVNFKKGCYPGQEIVARSQYLGKLKRRMAIVIIEANDVQVGLEIFSANDPSQPCGMIVNVEHNLNASFACLVEMKLADQEPGKVHLGAIDGPLLEFLPLPYAYLDITQ
jgi:folate-binding protein YgfZ